MSVNVFEFMVIQNILSFHVVRLIKHNLLIVFFAVCGVCLIPTCALQYNKEYAQYFNMISTIKYMFANNLIKFTSPTGSPY